jgi:DNA-directed RNA polymerase specialized sigma24 family protein
LFAPLETILDRNPGHGDAEREVASRIELFRTLQALRRLPAGDRHALLVAASGEIGLADAARRAGMAASTLRMRLLRARRRLRAILKEKT